MTRSRPWVVVALLWLGAANSALAAGAARAQAAATVPKSAGSARAPAAASSAPTATAGSTAPSPNPTAGAAAAPATPSTTTTAGSAAASAVPPSAASAETAPTPDSTLPAPPAADANADQIAEYAMGLFKRKRYSEAGDALQRAYQREPRPIFLFNVGQTYRKAGRYAEAAAVYKRFVEAAPEHPLVSDARGHEHTLSALVEQQERTSQIEISLMDQQAEASRVRQSLALEQRKTEEAQSALFAERARNKPVYRRPWFWGVVGGAAVAALAIGIAIVSWNGSVATPGMNQHFSFSKD